MMTDQLKIEARKSAATTACPATVDSWKAKYSPSAATKLGKNREAMSLPQHSKVCRAGCKILAVAIIAASALPVRAAEGPVYEVFGRALAPIANAVVGSPDGSSGAMVAECRINDGTGAAAAAKGARLRVAVQAPDRIRIDVVREGIPSPFTACRDGNQLWAVPAAPMTALAEAAGLNSANQDRGTAPPLLPLAIDSQMLAFLPLVFDVKDLGREENPTRRVLEFSLLPQLRETLKAEEFTGRAWIGSDDRPTRVVLSTPGGEVDIQIEKLNFADQLAATAWQPSEGQDALRLPASALNELFAKILGERAAAE